MFLPVTSIYFILFFLIGQFACNLHSSALNIPFKSQTLIFSFSLDTDTKTCYVLMKITDGKRRWCKVDGGSAQTEVR